MKNEQLLLFEGQEVKVKTDQGETLINLVHTAKCCGLTQLGNSGKPKVRWSNLKTKLISISSGDTNLTPQYIDEIHYILEEIDNTDDRNSIYMSSWLSRRLAMECQSDKAKQYKNFLATLDEKYSNEELQNNNQLQQLNSMASQISLVANTMSQIGQAFTGLEQYVRNSIQVKDLQIDEIKTLVGFRSSNTKRIVNEIKDKLSEKLGKTIYATSPIYKNIKEDIFREFKVIKYEDIPVTKYNAVYAYLDVIIEDKYSKNVVGGIR